MQERLGDADAVLDYLRDATLDGASQVERLRDALAVQLPAARAEDRCWYETLVRLHLSYLGVLRTTITMDATDAEAEDD